MGVIASSSVPRRGDPIGSFRARWTVLPGGWCLGGNSGLIRNIGDRAPGKNWLRQVIKDIGNIRILVNSMNSLDHAPNLPGGEHSWKMKTVTHPKSAMTKQAGASQKLEKPLPG
jgi:hypothetical protein